MPGNDERKVKKATKLDADCVVLDCEDAVAWSKKVHPTFSLLLCCFIIFLFPMFVFLNCFSMKQEI